MTLDDLIVALSGCPNQEALVEIDGCPPGEFHSYRGYYDQLALGTGVEPVTVEGLLAQASDVKGTYLEGYKGGEFKMTGSTPVWASEYGEASGIAIVGIGVGTDPVRLFTADISEYA